MVKLFPRYPEHIAKHPEIMHTRITAVEDHLEQSHQSNSGFQKGQFGPAMVLIVEILSGLSLVSPAFREAVLKLLGH